MYNIGDRLVYPMHGAGVVEAIEEKDILDEKRYYYIMRMPVGDVKVMIPVNSTNDVGIRDVIDKEKADEVMDAFCAYKADVTSNWNKRYRDNMEKIRSGDILDVAYVVKTLMLKEKMKGLSMGERKMLSSTRQILVSELIIAQGTTAEELEEKMLEVVTADLAIMNAETSDAMAEAETKEAEAVTN
jgi:CarD family transcriptional regulator